MSTRKPFHFSQQQHLKCLLRTLPPQQLKCALYKLRNVVGSQLEASCKMISYKCYEFTIGYKGHKAFGYGRNETEAHINCIQNFLELLIEDEGVFPLIKEMLTNGAIATETNEVTDKTLYSNPIPGKPIVTDETLALEMWPERFDGDKELENLTELNAFKGNMGNISAIEQDLSLSASKIDVRDLLGSLTNTEKETKKPMIGNYQSKLVQKDTLLGSKEYETEKYLKYKRDSLLSTKGTSLVSTAYLSRGEQMSQENDKRSREDISKKSLAEKLEENLNQYRKENNYRSAKENLQEPIRRSSQKENYKQPYLVPNELRNSKEAQLGKLSARELSKDRHKHIQAASPKSRKLESDAKCECHKHLLEAMNKWEKLEKEIAKLTEENKLLKDRLITKHSTQTINSARTLRTGSLTERHSEVPSIPNYMVCQTHRRLTYQPTVGGISVDKENNNKTNTNTEESMRRKSYEKGTFEKDILRIKSLSKEHRKPSVEDYSLKRNVLHSYRERPKEGSMTERSSSTSGLAARDPNRDMSSQWTGRAHYYKRKNW